jgi:hypothetical protein
VDPPADTFSGGIAFRMKKLAAFASATAPTLGVELRSGSDIATSALVTSAAAIPLTGLASTYTGYVARFDGAGVAVSAATDYWLVITLPAPESFASVGFAANTATVGFATYDGTTWTTTNTAAQLAAKWLGFVDDGRTGSQVTRRGVLLTGDIARTPQRLRVYVPDVDLSSTDVFPLTGSAASADSTLTQNELVVTVVARSGEGGVPRSFTVTVPKGASRGSQYLLGATTDRFDRVDEVSVRPGAQANLTIDAFGAIQWGAYDIITLETVP